jgi:GR25 family glycosyltransferase involved in LPS biosynthesis
MPKIAFHINQFSIRGTEIATFDYAYYNKQYLNNESIIVVPTNYEQHTHPVSGLTHNNEIEKKFQDNFEVFMYSSKKDLDDILIREGCHGFYILKSGQNDGMISDIIPTFVHCVFKCSNEHKHGTVYACISNTVNEISAPVVPHICIPLPKVDKNLREELQIPKDAVVFGRYGGIETFDIDFVKEVIKNVVDSNPNIYFLFMNTQPFHQHPQIIHVDKTTNLQEKAEFVNTCDAMLHARKEGESFGLAVAEFTTLGKPILTWKHDGPPLYHEHHNHLDVLGSSGMYYEDAKELTRMLVDFHPVTPIDFSTIFSPKNVMTLFQKHFLSHFQYRVRILCNWKSSKDLYKSWYKMIGDLPIQLVTSDPDYTVIINQPPELTIFNREKTIVMGMEPDTFTSDRWNWYGNKKDFLYFLDENYMNNCEWWLSHSKKTLLTSTPAKTKDNIISSVVSSQYIYPGHILRIEFLKIAEKELGMDLFGWDNAHGFNSYRGALPSGKEEGLEPYKYTFASENSSRNNYCTEKLFDAILSECLCFYWGCPNIDNFLDKRCCIYLDLTKPQESIQIIKKAIQGNEWEKRLPVIKAMKHRILNTLSFFPRILGLMKLDRLRKQTINLDHRPEKWIDHKKKCLEAQISNVERVSAIRGSDYPITEINKMFILTRNFIGPNKNTSGIVGCALSHYTLWKKIIQTNEMMLVMEDDVTFCSNFVDRMGILLQNIEKIEWDIVFLGHHKHEENYELHNLPLTHLQDKFGQDDLVSFQYMKKYKSIKDAAGLHGGGTFGYLMSVQGAKKMLEMVANLKFYFPVDYQLLEAALHQNLHMFVCAHPLLTSPKFGVDTTESDIQK